MELTANAGRSMEDLMAESTSTLCSGEEKIRETERELHKHKYALKASMLRGSGKSLQPMTVSVSNRNHSYGESSNTRIPEEDDKSEKLVITQLIEPIEQRLSILEEEDERLKEAIFRSIEERKILMNDIFKQLQAIHNHLGISNQEREYNSSFDEVLASIQALKDQRRPGLMQVLWQESKPSLISRYAKARAITIQGRVK